MWLVTLNSEGDFEDIAARIPADLGVRAYRIEASPAGARCAIPPEDLALPVFVHLADAGSAADAFLDWGVRHLRLQALISSGTGLPCGTEWAPSDLVVPPVCYRSVGRIEINSPPILYEEIKLDRDLQSRLAGVLLPGRSIADLGIWSARKPLTSSETRDWLATRISCQIADTQTADLAISAKQRGLRVGCAKAIASPDSKSALADAWVRVARALHG